VKNFTIYLGCSPDKASADDPRRYQLHLAKQHISPATINQACSAFQNKVVVYDLLFRNALRRRSNSRTRLGADCVTHRRDWNMPDPMRPSQLL
jgi:hypothetical protein